MSRILVTLGGLPMVLGQRRVEVRQTARRHADAGLVVASPYQSYVVAPLSPGERDTPHYLLEPHICLCGVKPKSADQTPSSLLASGNMGANPCGKALIVLHRSDSRRCIWRATFRQ